VNITQNDYVRKVSALTTFRAGFPGEYNLFYTSMPYFIYIRFFPRWTATKSAALLFIMTAFLDLKNEHNLQNCLKLL